MCKKSFYKLDMKAVGMNDHSRSVEDFMTVGAKYPGRQILALDCLEAGAAGVLVPNVQAWSRWMAAMKDADRWIGTR